MSSKFVKRFVIAGSPVGKHLENTLRLLIRGRKGRAFTEEDIEEVFCGDLRVSPDTLNKIYNLGKPNEWFVRLSSKELYNSLHMREIGQGYAYCDNILLLHADKNGVRGHIKWVPPTIGKDILEQIVKEIAKPEEGLTILPVGKGDRWAVDFQPATAIEEIPHFLEVEIGGECHTLLLQLNGRRIVCPLCGTSKHLPHACRSPLIRTRDNICLNERGEYKEREVEKEVTKEIEEKKYESDSATVTSDGEDDDSEEEESEEEEEIFIEDECIPDLERKLDWTLVEEKKRRSSKNNMTESNPATPEIKKKNNKRKPTHSNSPPCNKQNKNTHTTTATKK